MEIDSASGRFTTAWRDELARVSADLARFQPRFVESYRRLVSLEAWKTHLLEGRISSASLGFFLEAQNDGLVSHVLASLGSWRSALKSLRSCIENVCFCLYYMDHPVELSLWSIGKHALTHSAVLEYLQRHPSVSTVPKSVSGLEIIKKEYPVLSRAVHASAVGFRMTAEETGVRLWHTDQGKLGAWSTRELQTLCGINLLLLTMFRSELEGARLEGLRKAVSLAIPATRHKDVKQHLKVTLRKT